MTPELGSGILLWCDIKIEITRLPLTTHVDIMKTAKIHPFSLPTPPEIVISTSIYDEPHLSTGVKCAFCCESNKRCIILIGIVLVIGIIVAIVTLKGSGSDTSSTTSTNPCESYKADDLANSITLACFRTMWANAGCKSVVPDGYAGWYLRSPDGGKTVLCVPPTLHERCGAGSFGAVQNSVWRCDLDYRGY